MLFANIEILPERNFRTDTAVPNGTCGNCGDPAINSFETICHTCCLDYGLSPFPTYTYADECMFNSLHHRELRMFFFFNVYGL